MPAPLAQPDVLVLAGGGVVGEAWMNGLLAGLREATAIDPCAVEHLVGTSAGSIVAARLAQGRAPRRPSDPDMAGTGGSELAAADPGAPEPVSGDAGDGPGALGRGSAALRSLASHVWVATAPLASATAAMGAPGGALVRAAVLGRLPRGTRELGRLHASIARADGGFDGRLRICAVDRRRGRRVVFGAPGAPPASVADAVLASCAIPWVFAPVTIGGREYVDGAVWSVTNLDAAPVGRGGHVLCLDPTLGLDLRGWRHLFAASAAVELQILRVRGAEVRRIGPDAASLAVMGTNIMASAPGPAAMAAGYRQGLALAGERGD